MKLAVCLHGYCGTVSTGDFTTSDLGFKHLQETVVSKCDSVDFYVHCWQPEFEKQIEKMYSPKSTLFENQIDFDKVCQENGIYQNYIDELFQRSKTMYKNATASRILSFYYSRAASLNLAFNKDYDCILTTRFDISARGGSSVNQIKFDPRNDMDFLYTAEWNQKNVGYGDMWFYGSEQIMKEYSKIYQNVLSDFKPMSRYEKTLQTGWPDSNLFNVHDFSDPRQFTNEIDRQTKSSVLMKFPKWRITDSHLHHKWFCMNNGLYEKTRWI